MAMPVIVAAGLGSTRADGGYDTVTRLRPSALDRYKAASASATSSADGLSPTPQPMLTVIERRTEPRSTGSSAIDNRILSPLTPSRSLARLDQLLVEVTPIEDFRQRVDAAQRIELIVAHAQFILQTLHAHGTTDPSDDVCPRRWQIHQTIDRRDRQGGFDG
jgi:hypothetical protein